MSKLLMNVFTATQLLWLVVLTGVVSQEGSLHDIKVYIFAVPVLMLADYYLTLYGAWRIKKRCPGFDASDYELNPMWKSDVAQFKLLNFRHLVIVASTTLLLMMMSQSPRGWSAFCGLFGLIGSYYLAVVVEHIYFIAAFQYSQSLLGMEGTPVFFLLLYIGVLLISIALTTYFGPWFVLGSALGLIGHRVMRVNLERHAVSAIRA